MRFLIYTDGTFRCVFQGSNCLDIVAEYCKNNFPGETAVVKYLDTNGKLTSKVIYRGQQ